MITLAKSLKLADAPERERAATTFDQNVVVTAGAGTGKTTLLVDRLVQLLMREPEPLKITEIVALTFTNKAANEMKLRLRERLQSFHAVHLDRDPSDIKEEQLHREIKSLIDRYHLSKDQIDHRAREALRHIERSEIGTIHSFAATLLRLYPMEAGVDPQFREDDGAWFERHFEESWTIWLDQELAVYGARKEDWKEVLRKVSLKEIRDLAFSLCSETVQLDRLVHLLGDEQTPKPILTWLKKLEQKATNLIRDYPDEKNQVDKLIRACLKILREFLQKGELGEGILEEEKALLAEKEPFPVKAWKENDFDQAKELVRVAKHLCKVNRKLTRLLWDLLVPFVESCRENFLKRGFVSFDGLLVRARNLVRDRSAVREELKRRFKAILIDEFQDTDPIQYEILLYLAEQNGRQAKDWRKVKLTPGKIFVVGDPKQSIYAFRRADIEAYLEVIEEIIKAQNGMECRLTTNFRSHAGILNVVNGVFEHLIRPREGLQPSYVAIHPAESNGSAAIRLKPLSFRKVGLRRVVAEEGQINADVARRLEAESLARWLAEEILGKAEILNPDGVPVLVKPKDVAILMRSLTHVHQYLEPLRRHGIRFVVEGERHFYAVQEVIDAVNLLRATENPCDRSALVGVLRSPVGGLKDTEIYQLHHQDLLDYRCVRHVKGGGKEKLDSQVKELYEILYRLHQETRKLPVGEALSRVLASIPIKLLAALSFHGEQAVANLEKIREQGEMMGREGTGTLKGVIAMLERWVLDMREEGESALAEENVDAVRILSVHKAKGLEFPVVILAGCHTATDHSDIETEAEYDWSHGLVGLKTGEYWNLPGVFLAEKRRLRESEEERRVLYVAMTRAREHLMISCAPTGRRSSGSFLSLLEDALKKSISCFDESNIIATGNSIIELQVVRERLNPPGPVRAKHKEDKPRIDWNSYAQIWKRRTEEYDAAADTPLFLSPTLLKRREVELTERIGGRERPVALMTHPLLIGELAHRFLQDWDFAANPESFRDRLRPFLDKWLELKYPVDREEIQKEFEGIFDLFFFSEVYNELSSSQILGREVPLLIAWDGRIMEGVIDLLYEKDGLLYLADYKTDRVEKKELSEVAQSYHHQARIYSEAARRTLQRDVAGFKLIFLRLGEAIEV